MKDNNILDDHMTERPDSPRTFLNYLLSNFIMVIVLGVGFWLIIHAIAWMLAFYFEAK